MSHCYVSITLGASPIYSLGNVAECKGVLAGWHFGERQPDVLLFLETLESLAPQIKSTAIDPLARVCM
jgi:hypothetical protein